MVSDPKPLAQQLGELLQEAGARLRIGLRQQGHLPTVERMRTAGASWDEIGKAIGWAGHAVERWYAMETNSARKDEIAAKLAEAFIGPTDVSEPETGAQVVAKIRLCRMVKEALASYEEERTPSEEGWQQRIERVATGLGEALSFISRLDLDTAVRVSIKELRDALAEGQNAKDALPPASSEGSRVRAATLREAEKMADEHASWATDPVRKSCLEWFATKLAKRAKEAEDALPPAPEGSPAKADPRGKLIGTIVYNTETGEDRFERAAADASPAKEPR